MLNRFHRHHLAHIGAPGGVAYHSSAAAQQGDGPVARLLQSLHQAQRHKMAHMKGIRSRIKADIKGRLSVVDQLPDLLLICHLGNQAAGCQFVVNLHFPFLSFGFLSCSLYWAMSFCTACFQRSRKWPFMQARCPPAGLIAQKNSRPFTERTRVYLLPCYHLTSLLPHGSRLCRYPLQSKWRIPGRCNVRLSRRSLPADSPCSSFSSCSAFGAQLGDVFRLKYPVRLSSPGCFLYSSPKALLVPVKAFPY